MLTLHVSGFSPLEALELMYEGLEARRQLVIERIATLKVQIASAGDGQVRSRLKPAPQTTHISPEAPKKHRMTKAGRERVREAQQLRWKRFHREKRALEKAQEAARAPKPAKARPRTRSAPQEAMESAGGE